MDDDGIVRWIASRELVTHRTNTNTSSCRGENYIYINTRIFASRFNSECAGWHIEFKC